jgi:hypothetical protein
VQRFQDRVLVTAQLIDAATSLHIWAETYERPSADLIKVQNDIAQAVTDAVRRQLPGGSVNGTRQIRYSTDARANVLYWKGAYLVKPPGPPAL